MCQNALRDSGWYLDYSFYRFGQLDEIDAGLMTIIAQWTTSNWKIRPNVHSTYKLANIWIVAQFALRLARLSAPLSELLDNPNKIRVIRTTLRYTLFLSTVCMNFSEVCHSSTLHTWIFFFLKIQQNSSIFSFSLKMKTIN